MLVIEFICLIVVQRALQFTHKLCFSSRQEKSVPLSGVQSPWRQRLWGRGGCWRWQAWVSVRYPLLQVTTNEFNHTTILQLNACLWPWTTKADIRANFSKLRLARHLKAEYIIFTLMYGLLWSDNIWLRYNYLKICNLREQKNLNIEKIVFKVVQIKFLAMHITNTKLRFDIFTVGNVQNIFMEHDLYIIS